MGTIVRPLVEDNRLDSESCWRPTLKFYVFALIISWSAWMPLIVSRTGFGLLHFSIPVVWVIPGSVGPLLAACIVSWQEHRTLVVGRIRVPWRQGLSATIAGCAAVATTFIVVTAAILTRTPPHGWNAAAFGLYGVHVVMTLLGGPVFEEWGWRAFAQNRLQRHLGGLPAALIVGLGWAFWHAPLFLLHGWTSISPAVFVTMITALSVLLAWGFNLSGGWIVTTILMHAIFNRSSHVLGPFLGSAVLRPVPSPTTALMMALVAAALVIAVTTRGRLGRKNS